MWDLPGPGMEPISPALAEGFLTTGPPGKSKSSLYFKHCTILDHCPCKLEKYEIFSRLRFVVFPTELLEKR